MKLRFTKPRLGPCASTALVITRAWYLPEIAMRAPLGASSTLTPAPCVDKISKSSSNLRMLLLGLEMAVGGAAEAIAETAAVSVGMGAAVATGVLAAGAGALCWHPRATVAMLQ